ncbi:MAG: peptidylprolyl isomerase [bacterium]|nr:peptidylprolyl isomerase [bacterium]
MLRSLRKKTKIILWFIIIAFVGSIFFVWGMKTYQKSPEPIIASINNISLSPNEFNDLYQQYISFYRNLYKDNFNQNMLPKLEKAIVEQMIRDHILLNEAYRQKIKVNNEEIIDEIKKSFLDKEGKFDTKLYNTYVKNTPASWWHKHEQRIKNTLRIQKLQSLVNDQVKVSQKELLSFYQLEYIKAKVYHILIDPKKCLEEDRIKDYYQKNKNNFLNSPQVKASHILIKLGHKANRTESRKAKDTIANILEKVKKGDNFANLAKKFSQCPSKDKGGDLGYFAKGAMVPEFEEVVFNLKLDQVSNIVKTTFGYHIIKLTGKKEKEYKSLPEVKTEIIKSLSKEAEEIANKKALFVWNKLQSKKADFEKMAKKYSHSPCSNKGGYIGIIPKNLNYSDLKPDEINNLRKEIVKGWDIDPNFSDAAFSLKENSISKVIKSSFGYHIIKLEKLILPSLTDFEKEKESIQSRLLTDKKNSFFDDWYREIKSRYKIVVNSRFESSSKK